MKIGSEKLGRTGIASSKEGNVRYLSAARGRVVYDPVSIERILSFRTMTRDFELWWEAVVRFFTIFVYFVHILFMGWWDRQIWSYVGETDIELAQSLRRHQHGQKITQMLLHLGPTFIKVGQSLSTRVDLLRKEYIDELSQLQDRVPQFSLEAVYTTIEAELGKPVEELFETLDPNPLAAASLGQVHRVVLKDGQEAVVKVQRPDLIRRFQIDLCVLKRLARFLERSTELGRGREWRQIVDEFGRTLFEEIDYIQEGRNADRFRHNFRGHAGIVVPRIMWQYTARRVITMAYHPGIKVNQINALDEAGFDRQDLAVRLVRAYFHQLLHDGFFHADPHPGNIVVDKWGNIVLYDFGMVGRIPDETRVKIVNTFLNIVGKRTDAILKNLRELEMVTPWADLDEIRQVVDWALDNYYDVPHDQLNFEDLAEEMAEVMYYYPFKLPASFTYMFRALITLEGVSTTLYPQIQFMAIAVQYAQDFMGQSYLKGLFGIDLAKNTHNLIKEGLQALGIQGQSGAPSRVRLYYDEWVPLSRYVKACFLMMAMGQMVMMTMLVGVVLVLFRVLLPEFWLAALVVLVMLLLGFSLISLACILWLPSRKKQFVFNPPKHQPVPRRSDHGSRR